ncbi:MAG: VIT1/CCC1 transporter family protein [Bacteriovoracaceae bacterium]|nr:VIT1/CCC1 transporter family protein [Bacteriovoracaceae bacterium]
MQFGYYAKRYLKDVVYGANDGIITTFAVVASIEGAKLGTFAILAVGFASLFADGFSMATSSFLANSSDQDAKSDVCEEIVEENPTIAALVTFLAFMSAGSTPLLPYVFISSHRDNLYMLSAIIAITTMFLIGGFRTKVTGKNFFMAGAEMALLGGTAATVAFFIGEFAGRYQ